MPKLMVIAFAIVLLVNLVSIWTGVEVIHFNFFGTYYSYHLGPINFDYYPKGTIVSGGN